MNEFIDSISIITVTSLMHSDYVSKYINAKAIKK